MELRSGIVGVYFVFFFQAEDGIRDRLVTGVQTCALPISTRRYGADHWVSLPILVETPDTVMIGTAG